MSASEFPVSSLNQVKRIPARGSYDRETVHAIIDQAPLGHVAILSEQPHPLAVIPMLHGRDGDHLLLHGAQSSRVMQYIRGGQPVTVSFVLVDGYVLAKSLFHHSMNYRSAVVFGRGREIVDRAEKLEALRCISDRLLPGRWEDARLPNAQEMKATMVVRIAIETASAKVRSGGPKEESEDVELPHWSGVVPTRMVMGEPLVDSLSAQLPLPDYVRRWIEQRE